MLPSFIFCQVLLNFDKENYLVLFQLFIGCLSVYLIGILLGFILSFIITSTKAERNLFLAILSSPNTTSITLIMIEVMYPTLDNLPYESDKNSRERGLLYISLMSIFSNVWRWSVTYNLIEEINPNKKDKIDSENNFEERLINNNEIKTKNFKEIVKECLNIPIIVSIISLILCMSTTIKNLLIEPGSIIRESLFNVHLTISKGYVFAVIFVLGLNISNIIFKNQSNNENENIQNEDNNILNYKIILLTISKLIIIPIIATPLIFLLQKYNFITDPVLIYLLLFMSASPFAINLIIICNIKKAWVNYVSLLMLITYCLALITITVANSIFLYLLNK